MESIQEVRKMEEDEKQMKEGRKEITKEGRHT